MKYLFLILLIITTGSCKNTAEKDAIITTTEGKQGASKVPSIPTATFISETLDLTHCESAVFNKNNETIYASLIGNAEVGDGSIAIFDLKGAIINKQFVSNLNDPKGIAITKNRLYVSDVTELVEVDLVSGEILKKHTMEGIKFLNDVTVSKDNEVFVSDTFTSKIYKLDTEGNFSLWLENEALDNPNGLLIKNNDMYVASWGGGPDGGRVSRINMATKKIDTLTEVIGNLDGIRPYDDNRLIISDWKSGNIHLLDQKGNTQKIVTVGQSVGDIAYVAEHNLLLLPMNKQSRLLFYKLK